MWWWTLLLPFSLAAPIQESLVVGQLYSHRLATGTKVTQILESGLPDWISVSSNELLALPTEKDLGRASLKLESPGSAAKYLTLRVQEDDTNPCGVADTTWIEIIYSESFSIEEKAEMARKMAKTLEIDIESIRVLGFDYSRKFRQVENIAKEGNNGVLTVIKPYCDGEIDAIDQATDDMDKLLDDDEDGESEYDVTITKGKVLSRKNRQGGDDVISVMDFRTNEPEAVTKPSTKTTTSRTTRQSNDNPPVRLNSLTGFSCTEGVLCESVVPEWTFKDPEEGDTYKLQLSVALINGEGGNWLFYKDKKLQGVPLMTGEYQFRLDARDRQGQMASAPFSVSVKPSSDYNHLITFQMDLTKSQDIQNNPELLADFIRKLSQVTRSSTESIALKGIVRDKERTILQWSNNTLPYKTCSEVAIEKMMAPMLTKRRNMMNRQFETAMTSRFNLRKIEYSLLGNCLKNEDSLATTVSTVEATRESTIPWVWLIAALVLLILLAICVILICTKKKGKKGTNPSEYVGKGLPVVFPEEVPDDHDLAHATTPMLTKEERPPLKVSQHENPLYRPPPPLVAASPRAGSATGSLPTQRMPPPYVPP